MDAAQCSGAKSELADVIRRQVDSEHKEKLAVTSAHSVKQMISVPTKPE